MMRSSEPGHHVWLQSKRLLGWVVELGSLAGAIRMLEELFIASYDEAGKRHAVFEDDGLTAWLYLHGPSADPKHPAPVEKACFVYNRKAPIDARDVGRHCNLRLKPEMLFCFGCNRRRG